MSSQTATYDTDAAALARTILRERGELPFPAGQEEQEVVLLLRVMRESGKYAIEVRRPWGWQTVWGYETRHDGRSVPVLSTLVDAVVAAKRFLTTGQYHTPLRITREVASSEWPPHRKVVASIEQE